MNKTLELKTKNNHRHQVGDCSIELIGKQRSMTFIEQVLLSVALSYLGWCFIYGFGVTRGWW